MYISRISLVYILSYVYILYISYIVLDTAGQEEFHAIRDTFIKSSDGFLLVFSFSDRHRLVGLKVMCGDS